MKHLKKHPKQQRMEEMTFPITKPHNIKGFKSKAVPIFKESAADDNYIIKNSVFIANINDVPPGDHKIIWEGNLIPVNHKEKVTMTGHEWLRSINDDMGLTLMNRLGWHILAIVVFIGAIWLSAYILTHGLVCAPASLNGKTVINCLQK